MRWHRSMIAELNDVRLRFLDEGRGVPVVFLHGLAANLDTWKEQAGRLADHYRTIRIDLRGHGGSSTPAGPWTVADLAVDVANLLHHLRIERAHIVGHSAGGVVAARLALDRPALVASLCLVAMATECSERVATECYLRWADTAEREGMLATLTQSGMRREVDASDLGDPIGFAWACRAIATLCPEPLTPRLVAVHCPSLIVVGDRDPIGVGGAVKASRALAGSELLILPGLGHLPFEQDADGFAARLRAFLDRQTAAAG